MDPTHLIKLNISRSLLISRTLSYSWVTGVTQLNRQDWTLVTSKRFAQMESGSIWVTLSISCIVSFLQHPWNGSSNPSWCKKVQITWNSVPSVWKQWGQKTSRFYYFYPTTRQSLIISCYLCSVRLILCLPLSYSRHLLWHFISQNSPKTES